MINESVKASNEKLREEKDNPINEAHRNVVKKTGGGTDLKKKVNNLSSAPRVTIVVPSLSQPSGDNCHHCRLSLVTKYHWMNALLYMAGHAPCIQARADGQVPASRPKPG